MGDIGEPVRRREYVPMPESVPVQEPSIPAQEPSVEPVKVPDREKVPA